MKVVCIVDYFEGVDKVLHETGVVLESVPAIANQLDSEVRKVLDVTIDYILVPSTKVLKGLGKVLVKYDAILVSGRYGKSLGIPYVYGTRETKTGFILRVPTFKTLKNNVQLCIDVAYIFSKAIQRSLKKVDAIVVSIGRGYKYKDCKYHAIDFETTGLEDDAKITVLGVASGNSYEDAFVQAFNMTDEHERKQALGLLRKILESDATIIAHNVKFELKLLRRLKLPVEEASFYCTMLAESLIDEQAPLNLETVALKYGFPYAWKKQQWKSERVTKTLLEYCGIDAIAALYIHDCQKGNFPENVLDILVNTSKVLSKMELEGIKVDTGELLRLKKYLKDRFEFHKLLFESEVFLDYEKRMGKKVPKGTTINIQSAKQLAKYLPPIAVTEKGNPSFKSTDLLKYDIDVYRRLGLLKRLKANIQFLEQYEKNLRFDGCIHSEFTQTVARTGRLSCRNPNLQNIPRESIIRKVFVPTRDYLVNFDYSQLEPVVFATVTDDKKLLSVFKDGLDLHSFVASKIFNIPYEEIVKHKDGKYKNQRFIGKTINLGIMYQLTARGLLHQVHKAEIEGVIDTLDEAQEIIDTYYETFPQAKEWVERTIKHVLKHRYSEDYFGRRRHFKPDEPDYKVIRQGVNHVIQSTGNLILQQALYLVHQYGFKICVTVHDSIVLDMYEEELNDVEQVTKLMVEPFPEFLLKVDVKKGRSLYYEE